MYTGDAILGTLIYLYGANADVAPDKVNDLTEKQIAELTLGSKAQWAAWFTYTGMIWSMKFCVLFFYKRLTIGTLQHRMIPWLMAICGLSWLVVVLNNLLSCLP